MMVVFMNQLFQFLVMIFSFSTFTMTVLCIDHTAAKSKTPCRVAETLEVSVSVEPSLVYFSFRDYGEEVSRRNKTTGTRS